MGPSAHHEVGSRTTPNVLPRTEVKLSQHARGLKSGFFVCAQCCPVLRQGEPNGPGTSFRAQSVHPLRTQCRGDAVAAKGRISIGIETICLRGGGINLQPK